MPCKTEVFSPLGLNYSVKQNKNLHTDTTAHFGDKFNIHISAIIFGILNNKVVVNSNCNFYLCVTFPLTKIDCKNGRTTFQPQFNKRGSGMYQEIVSHLIGME